jgi:hypothetical protein
MSEALECFYTLPQCEEGSGSVRVRWVVDPQLRRRTHRYCQELLGQDLAGQDLTGAATAQGRAIGARPEAVPDGMSDAIEAQVAYGLMQQLQAGHAQAQPQPQPQPYNLIQGHWVAFLARVGEAAARRLHRELSILPSGTTVGLGDLMQLALETTLNPAEFFRGFDINRAQSPFWYASLKKYSRTRLEGMLCDRIRSIEGLTTFRRTDLGLAARSSEKRVLEALRFAGLGETEQRERLTLWKCFQEVRQAGLLDVASATGEQFEAVVERLRQLTGRSLAAPEALTAVQGVGAAVRRYVDRPVQSLDAPRFGDDSGGAQVDFVVSEGAMPLEALQGQQEQATVALLQGFLQQTLGDLPAEGQRIPFLLHGLSLIQSQVGMELGKDQATISRHYKKLVVQLLGQLAQWSQGQFQVVVGPELLEGLKSVMMTILEVYYPEVVMTELQDGVARVSVAAGPDPKATLTAEPNAVPQVDPVLHLLLVQELRDRFETRLNFTFKAQGPAIGRVETLVVERCI